MRCILQCFLIFKINVAVCCAEFLIRGTSSIITFMEIKFCNNFLNWHLIGGSGQEISPADLVEGTFCVCGG